MGNLHSVYKKVSSLGVDVSIASKAKELTGATHIILPGVGHFGKAMDNLKKLDLIEALHEQVSEKHIPILGICLGMQLMANSSEEGEAQGLGWFDARVRKFEMKDKLHFKVPHTGWNTIEIKKNHPVLHGINNQSEFYFVHSYYFDCNENEDVLCSTNYEINFTSSIQKNNILGMQFHPEKSHDLGELLFKNFISL